MLLPSFGNFCMFKCILNLRYNRESFQIQLLLHSIKRLFEVFIQLPISHRWIFEFLLRKGGCCRPVSMMRDIIMSIPTHRNKRNFDWILPLCESYRVFRSHQLVILEIWFAEVQLRKLYVNSFNPWLTCRLCIPCRGRVGRESVWRLTHLGE